MLAQYLWIILSLGAAVIWGLGYALSEKVLNTGLHPSILMLVTGLITVPLFIWLACYQNQIKPGIALISSNPGILTTILINALCTVLGAYFILLAINLKNATLVNMIEMSYPLFTAFFAYILFREVQLNQCTLVGGAFIFMGLSIIAAKG